MTLRQLRTLKKFGFVITESNVYTELVFKAEYGTVELSLQTNRIKEVSFRNIIDKVYKHGWVDGEKKGQKNIQERIKGILNIPL